MDSSNGEKNTGDGRDYSFESRIQEILGRLNEELSREIMVARASGLSAEEQEQKISEIEKNMRDQLLSRINEYRQLQEESANQTDDSEIKKNEIKEKEKKIKESTKEHLLKIYLAAQKGVQVAKTRQAQTILNNLSFRLASQEKAVDLMTKFAPYLLGEKDIVLSTDDQKSEFVKEVERYREEDPITASYLIDAVVDNHGQYGKERKDVEEMFGIKREDRSENQNRGNNPNFERIEHLFANLSSSDREFFDRFLHDTDFYIDTFVEKINQLRSKENEGGELAKEIRDVHQQLFGSTISEANLKAEVEKRIMTKVAENITNRLNDIYIQIYMKIFTIGADKPFEEAEREDLMRGIEVLRNEIERSFFRIKTEVKELEQQRDDRVRDLTLYYHGEEENTIYEMGIDGIRRPVPRTRPTPILKPISLSDFSINLISEFDHWRARTGYSHNASYTYSFPAHEGSFYKGLAKYAEQIKGISLDSFMLLPDAPLVQEAFVLYTKLLQEEYARIDWRLRPDMFSNKLSEFNNGVEKEVANYLRISHGKELSDMRINNAIKSAVGFFARGVYLTESETNAFADPVDAKGTGFFPSYGTNDASPIMALNPLHRILRWQGQGNFNQAFFIPVTGDAGKFFGGWDHNSVFRNITAYKDQFKHLENGIEGSNKNLFIDTLLGVAKTGSVFFRGGWRNNMMYEPHYVYKGELNSEIDLIKSFRAVDVIGYEAVKYFLSSLNSDFYNNFKLPSAAEKMELYEFIFNRYFKAINENANFSSYMSNLSSLAKEEMKKNNEEITEESLQKKIDGMFTDRTMARIIALRFPTKFLKIDKNRFHYNNKEDQYSRWNKIFNDMINTEEYKNITNDEFDRSMKDLAFIESYLRMRSSDRIFETAQMTRNREGFSLGDYDKLMKNLTEESVKTILREKFGGERTDRDINRTIKLYELIKKNYLNESFLDNKAMDMMSLYPFAFGVEDVDSRLIAFRGTGPRMAARSIGDIALLEDEVINGLLDLPKLLHKISIDGKNDFSPIIEYLQKAKNAFDSVHGVGDEFYKFAYNVSGLVVNYFKKDSISKAFGGIFGLGRINSIAAEYAGRSAAVWEWDSSVIDRYMTAVESYGILPLQGYNMSIGPRFVDRKIKILGLEFKLGRKIQPDFKWTAARFRKEFGGDFKAIAFDMVNKFLPIVMALILWQYLKEALEDAQGKKR